MFQISARDDMNIDKSFKALVEKIFTFEAPPPDSTSTDSNQASLLSQVCWVMRI